MIRYVVSRFQQRFTQPMVRAYASSGDAPKVLVPRIPRPRDEVAHAGEMKPPLLPPCPNKTQAKPAAPEAPKAQTKPQPKPAEPTHDEHHAAPHDEVVNNIGGVEVNLLHH